MIRPLASLTRSGIALLITAVLLSPQIVSAQTPDATPQLPEGPLGVQIQWLLDTLNTPADSPSTEPIEQHVSPDFLATIPADKLAADFLKLHAEHGPFVIKADSFIMTMDLPPTHSRFVLVGSDGTEIPAALSVDRESGLITGLSFDLETSATPVASPAADSDLPPGLLGEQIRWVVETLNTGASESTSDQLGEHFTADFLKQVPATQLGAVFGQLHGQVGTVTIEAGSLATSRDMPPTSARFILVGEHGTRLQASIQIDRESGKIAGLLFQPAAVASPPVASPAASPAATMYRDEEVQFTSGPDTIYGSLMAPRSAATPLPAALIISGSGPTDRNGNSGTLTAMNTNLNLARTLADNGVISLRYDKLGSGQTGLGTHTSGEGIDYNLFLQEARDAAAFLTSQPGVDPGRLILVGHSEGALFALVLAQELTAAGTPPVGVILVSPLSIRYLDILKDQLEPQFAQAVEGGQMTQQQADDAKQELDTIITSLRTHGTLPETVSSPALAQIFSPTNAAFLAQIDKIDPAEVAASLPSTLPVLVLHGGKDQQVTAAQVQHLMAGFEQAGNTEATLVELPDADHLMKVITGTPNPAVDYANPNLPFSPKAVEVITEFLAAHGLAG
ncbi:MAG: alpha/beta fold hydrolase [Thermomicrobiales bacterium]